MSTNCRGSDESGLLPEACELAGITWATWLLDDPRYLLKPDEFEGTGRNRLGFCWDRNGIDGWRDSGFQNAHLLPLATNEKLFSPGEGIDGLTARIVFVGSPRFASGFGFFAGLDGSDAAMIISNVLEEDILNERRSPTDEVIKDLLETFDGEKTLDIEARRRLPAFAIQQANLAYRVKYLNSLAELKPVVFGTGWEGMLDERIELRAPLDFYTELPRLYKTDAVHISLTNLQMRSHPNQRPFDVGACGRAVLNDRLESLPDLFGKELCSEMTFESRQELFEKAVSLVGDQGKRLELGERLRENVLGRHTIRHRVDEILRVCRSEAQ
ncbi:MAG TPA: hypothetical protein ENH10_07715 [Bacteroidetes bacterium]|nr:hypothetical protein BMS3Bbin04_00522 [bacterium BMS3Bbin04]HDO65899.1 hypothetical protein [Bacteroidota bacterium]HEX05024.1 hypothetical protein [Bacteroidota bacterium]